MKSGAHEMSLTISLKDPRAKEIVENITLTRRDEVIEKYIILGEMVASHASISTSKETVEEFFSPLRQDIETIREQIRLIIPTLSTPTKKGKMTVETVYASLKEHFMDDSFEDVSRIGKYSDILATTPVSKTPILIELKDYSGTVPSSEVEKFWRDIERRGTHYGIFISLRTGISKCSSCITVKTEMNKTAIFVNNSELNWSGHIFAFYVIKKIVEIESLKKKELKGEEINKVIARANKHVQELQKLVNSIQEIGTIADRLKTTCKNNLDELINLSNSLKRTMNERICDILTELEKVDV
ncbi:MAG: restriction endonuclease [Candidatus Bathyarchaeota archaeon]|nr:restriction endonuclease [Candidatus Bathyarchaeota archaeon]